MQLRVISAIVGIIILGFALKSGGWIFLTTLGLANIAATYELYTAFKNLDKNIAVFPSVIISIASLITINFYLDERFQLIPLYVFIMIFLLFSYNILYSDKNRISDIAFTVFSFSYTSLLFMYCILVRNLNNGFYFAWWVFLTIWACDTGAYFIGCGYGKRKLVPLISPHKTIEGSVGGILTSIIVSIFFARYFLPKVSLIEAIVFGILISIVSQVGDLSASLIKRYCKIKDFSNIIPGHGGILDRFDSALFSFPAAYYYIVYIIIYKGWG